jgi:hypothetical protein
MFGSLTRRLTVLTRPAPAAPRLANDGGTITADVRAPSPPALVNDGGAVTAEARN